MTQSGQSLRLWDVRDVHAHVRALIEPTLRLRTARLDETKKESLVDYLVEVCWLLSGLEADGRTPRYVWAAYLSITYPEPRWSSLYGRVEGGRVRLGAWVKLERADAIAADVAERIRAHYGYRVEISTCQERPRGAYDPLRGLAFSTYSRRILSNRIWDWYRDTFGDSRYGGRIIPVSLEDLGGGAVDSDGIDDYMERVPLGRLEALDRLNPHAYRDRTEEVELNALVG